MADQSRGAPADFGGRVIPNPKNIKPVLDTDIKSNPKDKSSPKPPHGFGYSSEPYHPKDEPIKKDISNAPLDNPIIPGPIRSFKHGTDYVPETGLALLHKGEKVIPKEKTTMKMVRIQQNYGGPLDENIRPNEDPAMMSVPSYQHGTSSVPETGLALLHKGEKVIPKEKNVSEHSPEEKAHFHRAMSKLHTGGLHRALGISEDKPIPMAKKEEAAHSANKHTAAMGRLAVAMHGWK